MSSVTGNKIGQFKRTDVISIARLGVASLAVCGINKFCDKVPRSQSRSHFNVRKK